VRSLDARARIAHSFLNTGNVDTKFLLVATPAGLEKFFEEAFDPTNFVEESAEVVWTGNPDHRRCRFSHRFAGKPEPSDPLE